MRMVIETLRFIAVFYSILVVFGTITYLTFLTFDMNIDTYSWILIMFVFILTVVLYQTKGWGKVYHNKVLWTSVILIILTSILFPDVSPTHLHSNVYAYSYGFPFKFLTIYIENGNTFVIPNLFSKKNASWSIDTTIFANFILWYFLLQTIYKGAFSYKGTFHSLK
ncbi:hypothetical protein ACFFIS_12740 [Virgibacillus soli]|uniref:Uncharacterized protein n=1 Tax=Paracerasibacillus soli TaxID=480284 RepID=A0ABU5CPU2_9BACI|nr:hypothetical protein [Virgibacillus soli]MDY0407847.1 hypothetical protein [Virgibacillus soli]